MALPRHGGSKYVASGPGHKKKASVVSSGPSSAARSSSSTSIKTVNNAAKSTAMSRHTEFANTGPGVKKGVTSWGASSISTRRPEMDEDEEERPRRRGYVPREVNIPDYSRSAEVRRYQDIVRQMESNRPGEYTPSADVLNYRSRLQAQEANKPGAFQSRYSPQIESILQGILNRPAFDISKDSNYKQLYDQMKESYLAQGDRAMRDTMGQAAVLTGGYGNSYAVSAAGQAYNDYLQKLNSQNINLMNMAYGMYADDRSNDYSKLNAIIGLDNTDYGRYRDTVGDYYQDLNYLANRYSGEYDRDYGRYRDKMSDYLNDRNYYANRYATEYANDYGQYRDRVGFENDALGRDYQQYRDEIQQMNMENEMRYRKAQDLLAQKNLDREFGFKQSQADLQQRNYEDEKAYNRQQDALRMAMSGGRSSGGRGGGGGGGYDLSSLMQNLDSTVGGASGGWWPFTERVRHQLYEKAITPHEAYLELIEAANIFRIPSEKFQQLLKEMGINEKKTLEWINFLGVGAPGGTKLNEKRTYKPAGAKNN